MDIRSGFICVRCRRPFHVLVLTGSLAAWAQPCLSAPDIYLLAEATQAYASCVATRASQRPAADVSLTVDARVRNAKSGCAELRQRVVDALSPIERAEYLRTIDRDIDLAARALAGEATSDRP